MQLSDIPAKIPVPFGANAGAGNITYPIPTTPQSGGRASLDQGFPPITFTPVQAGGIPPFGQDENGILYWLSVWARWTQAGGGVPQYDASFQSTIGGYPQYAMIQSATTEGVFYLSTTDNNVTNPDTGGAGWATLSSYILANAALTGISTAPTAPVNSSSTQVANTFYADRSATNAQNAAEAFASLAAANAQAAAEAFATAAANAAQNNAEVFAQSLAGNLGGQQSATTNTVFTSTNYGQILRLTGGAIANSTFTMPTPLSTSTESSILWMENSSNFNLLNHVAGGTIPFYGMTSAAGWVTPGAGSSSMTLTPDNAAIAIGTPSGWLVPFNTMAFVQFASQQAPLVAVSTHGISLVANYSGSVSVSFTAPSKGTVIAFGGINLGNSITSGSLSTVTLSLKINGSQVDGDFTQTSMNFFGTTAVAAGTSVTVTSAVTVNTVNTNTTGTYRVAAIFVPTT